MKGRHSQRGAALTAALIVVVTVAGLGAYLIQIQAATARRQALSIDTRTALYTAEAGLAEAAYQVSQGRSGNIGSSSAPAEFNGNKFWVEAEEDSDGQISLTSTGLAGHSRFRVNLSMVPNQNPVARLGVFGDEGVEIGNRVLVDGYDASEGNYVDVLRTSLPFPTSATKGVIGSNGDIEIDDGTGGEDKLVRRVDEAFAGPFSRFDHAFFFEHADQVMEQRYQAGLAGTFPDYSMIAGRASAGRGGVILRGATTQILRERERKVEAVLPPVVLPSDLPVIDAGRVDVSTDADWSDRNGYIEHLCIDGPLIMYLRGPMVLHTRHLEVKGGAWLSIDDKEGPVTIYCEEEFHAHESSIISMDDETTRHHGFSLLVPPPADEADDHKVKFDCLGDIRGIIYAPGHDIELKGGLHLYGSLVGKRVRLQNDAWVTVDQSLTVGGAGFPALPKRLRWTAVSATDDDILTASSSAASSMEDSLPEQIVEVLFLNTADEKETYSGHIDLFDPTVAERILSVRWQDPDTLEFSDWMQPAGASPDDLIARWREKLRQVRAEEAGVVTPTF